MLVSGFHCPDFWLKYGLGYYIQRIRRYTIVMGLMEMQVTRLLKTYQQRFEIAPIFSEEEVRHYFLPIEDVIDTYVVQGPGRSSPLIFDPQPKIKSAPSFSNAEWVICYLGTDPGCMSFKTILNSDALPCHLRLYDIFENRANQPCPCRWKLDRYVQLLHFAKHRDWQPLARLPESCFHVLYCARGYTPGQAHDWCSYSCQQQVSSFSRCSLGFVSSVLMKLQ